MYQFNFQPVFENLDLLLYGAWLTVRLSFLAMILGLVVSLLGAVAKTSGIRPLRWLVDVYVEVIRNTPFLIQIFFIFFGLPAVGISMSPNTAALVALVINVGAYGTEIIRAGIESIPKGQIEAGRALGLSPVHIFRYVVVVPALRNIYPALERMERIGMLQWKKFDAIVAQGQAHAEAVLDAALRWWFETRAERPPPPPGGEEAGRLTQETNESVKQEWSFSP